MLMKALPATGYRLLLLTSSFILPPSSFRYPPPRFRRRPGGAHRGQRGDERHDVDAVPTLVRAQALYRLALRDAVAAAQARHAVNLREGARDDQVRVVADERDGALVVGRLDVVIISLVNQHDRLARHLREERAHLALRREARGRVVGIADVDEAGARRRAQHLL